MKNLVAVIIPIYKEKLNHNEQTSLKQCLKVLSSYPIIFISPENLDTSIYQHHAKDKVKFEVVSFSNDYFKNIDGYNRLMLSSVFYKKFLAYKFILIHQLDAYVFKDELVYWCKQGYDFIGAPHPPHENNKNEIQFLNGYSKIVSFTNRLFNINHKISNVGNGGLSLRKTATCYKLVKYFKRSVKNWGTNNEDGFFKYWANILYPIVKLPSDAVALRFSIESEPSNSLSKLDNQLPFGCHAFEKYEPLTWRPFINEKISH